jgi:transposase
MPISKASDIKMKFTMLVMSAARKLPSFTVSKARRGAMKVIVTVAASMLRSAYYMLSRRVPYQDLGPDHFDARNRSRTASRLLKRLKELGIEVL